MLHACTLFMKSYCASYLCWCKSLQSCPQVFSKNKIYFSGISMQPCTVYYIHMEVLLLVFLVLGKHSVSQCFIFFLYLNVRHCLTTVTYHILMFYICHTVPAILLLYVMNLQEKEIQNEWLDNAIGKANNKEISPCIHCFYVSLIIHTT